MSSSETGDTNHGYIAVVDDDVAFADSLVALLDTMGFNSRAFADVHSLLSALDGSVQAVLLDVHMPGLSGRVAVRAIIEAAPRLRIISITSETRPDRLTRLLTAGARAVLGKPLQLADLLASLPAPHRERPRSASARDPGGTKPE